MGGQPCEELDGDTLNIFQLDREHLGLYLLDVSGHGASAAMLSVALHRVLTPVPGPTSLLTRLQDGGPKYDIVSPAVVCRELNSLFPMDADAVIPQYFTLIYGALAPRRGNSAMPWLATPHLFTSLLGGRRVKLENTVFRLDSSATPAMKTNSSRLSPVLDSTSIRTG